MGIVSSDDFLKEIDKFKKPVEEKQEDIIPSKIIDINKGRGNNNEVPESLRKLLGVEALLTSSKEIIDVVPVSASSISAYKHGATSTASYHNSNPALKSHIRNKKDRISRRASKVLVNALDTIDEQSLADIGPMKASIIARNMSSIIKDMSDDNDDNDNEGGKNIQNNIIFYSPAMKSEEDFERIHVPE